MKKSFSLILLCVFCLMPFTTITAFPNLELTSRVAGYGAISNIKWNAQGNQLAVIGTSGLILHTKPDFQPQVTGYYTPGLSVFWHPGGKQIAIVTYRGDVDIFDIGQQVTIKSIKSEQAATELAWNSDGLLLAAGYGDGSVKIFDRNWSVFHSYNLHSKYIISLDWSRDGQFIATTSLDNKVGIWNTQTRSSQTLSVDAPLGVHFNSTSQLLAFTQKNKLTIIDPQSMNVKNRFNIDEFRGFGMAWNPGADQIAIGRGAGNVTLIDVNTSQIKDVLTKHNGTVDFLTWGSTQQIVTVDHQSTMRLWDANNLNLEKTIDVYCQRPAIASLSPDGSKIAFSSTGADPQACVLSIDGTRLIKLSGAEIINATPRFRPAWNPSGTQVAFSTFDENQSGIAIWDSATGQIIKKIADVRADDGIAWNPVKPLLATVSVEGVRIVNIENGNIVQKIEMNTETKEVYKNGLPIELEDRREPFQSVAWSSDGRRLAAIADNGYMVVVNVELNIILYSQQVQPGINGGQYTIGWTADNARIISNGTVLDARTGKFLENIPNIPDLNSYNSFTDSIAYVSNQDLIVRGVRKPSAESAIKLGKEIINSISWDEKGKRLIVLYQSGLLEVIETGTKK